jgi:hypothetical protein
MKRILISGLLWLTGMLLFATLSFAQNSVLVNFGSNTCYNSVSPAFSLLNNPLGSSPSSLAACNLSSQLPDFYSVFIAYNPKNNKVYVADIRSGTQTKIWVLDVGLPQNIACPSSIPVTPTYAYSYISNNFEFDNNGDLWSLSNYDPTTGQCNMDKFDVNTGVVINSRVLQFPLGNFPTSVTSGDLTILPNGRMFATLGSFPSRLYEINNYSSTSTNASATFLQTMPNNCYGIAYLNGQLEITGIDFAASLCYYFDYSISTNTLGTQKPFQIGEAPIDNSSFTPSVGTTKQLLNAVKVNNNTADLTYEIYVRNLGNVVINNINVSDDLTAVFGAGNVSNIQTSFVPGANLAGLALNPFYNGNNVRNILMGAQNLPNQTSANNDYYFKVLLQCRVTNLSPSTNYLNSAVGRGTVGSNDNGSLIVFTDSSNNGPAAVVDPNNNGNASEINENVPTPFNFGLIPVKFVRVTATFTSKTSSLVSWEVATPTVNAGHFEVEFSTDGRNWKSASQLPITDPSKSRYQYNHSFSNSGNLYYRIKEIDIDGAYIYSNVVLLRGKTTDQSFIIYPNPAKDYLQVSLTGTLNGKYRMEMFDVTGRRLLSKESYNNTEEINTSSLQDGTYLLKLSYNGDAKTQKILVVH